MLSYVQLRPLPSYVVYIHNVLSSRFCPHSSPFPWSTLGCYGRHFCVKGGICDVERAAISASSVPSFKKKCRYILRPHSNS
ncbi:hypothetical protein GDO78_002216 [Eleutherodactylus coqui]|uniref:Uncharacterized protein n=1 Tax=Eleutherodactylus coqui TaxID=57060 RepID=A0A8J6K0N4_ELECQ|nr:hypothetical protein GDO78_002216 [Eleutherodactylus coqui]